MWSYSSGSAHIVIINLTCLAHLSIMLIILSLRPTLSDVSIHHSLLLREDGKTINFIEQLIKVYGFCELSLVVLHSSPERIRCYLYSMWSFQPLENILVHFPWPTTTNLIMIIIASIISVSS
jgi:hypothetical protein